MDSYTKNIFHLFRAIFEECYAVLCGCGSGINGSNVFTVVDKMIMAKEKDTGCSYARKKPVELYEELIHNFSKDKHWSTFLTVIVEQVPVPLLACH